MLSCHNIQSRTVPTKRDRMVYLPTRHFIHREGFFLMTGFTAVPRHPANLVDYVMINRQPVHYQYN